MHFQQPYVTSFTLKDYQKPFPQQRMWKNTKCLFLPVRIKDVYIFYKLGEMAKIILAACLHSSEYTVNSEL